MWFYVALTEKVLLCLCYGRQMAEGALPRLASALQQSFHSVYNLFKLHTEVDEWRPCCMLMKPDGSNHGSGQFTPSSQPRYTADVKSSEKQGATHTHQRGKASSTHPGVRETLS